MLSPEANGKYRYYNVLLCLCVWVCVHVWIAKLRRQDWPFVSITGALITETDDSSNVHTTCVAMPLSKSLQAWSHSLMTSDGPRRGNTITRPCLAVVSSLITLQMPLGSVKKTPLSTCMWNLSNMANVMVLRPTMEAITIVGGVARCD